jgi:hypothetical protein
MNLVDPSPEWLDQEALEDYMLMRKRIKKPMSERRMRQFMARIRELHEAGHDVNQSLDEATDHQWLDLYEPKDKSISRKPSAVVDATQDYLRRQSEHAERASKSQIPEHLRRPRRVA